MSRSIRTSPVRSNHIEQQRSQLLGLFGAGSDCSVTPLLQNLNITRLPTATRPRQPPPNKRQRSPPRLIKAHRATGPASQDFALGGDAVKKQLASIGAGHAANLVAHANSAALVGA